MKLILSLLIVWALLTGCAVFKTPNKTLEGPAVPTTPAEKSQAWAADVIKQQQKAEREKFEKDLSKSANSGQNQ